MPPSGRDEEWLRAQLYALGGPDPDIAPLRPLLSTYTTAWSQAEDDQAVLFLTQASEARRNGEVKTLTKGPKVKHDKWSFEDYETVLKQIVGPCFVSVGVIASVLHHLAAHQPKKARTGSLKFRKSVKENDIHSLMSSLMTTTITHNEFEQLRVLANCARTAGYPIVVSRALPTAVRMDKATAVQILVEEGADTNTCSEVFLECVAAGKLDFIHLLLRSQTPVSPSITTNALPGAVKLGDVTTVQLLLAHGAGTEFQKGLALENAIDASRTDLIILLLLCKNHPAAATAGSMVSYVWSNPELFAGLQRQLIELLLNGGACGNEVDAVLLGAVEQKWGELVQLLMGKGASITSCNGGAYRQAIQALDYEMLQILDTGELGPALATDIFGSLYTTKHGAGISPEDWWKLATLLLAQGAAGDIVHEALINRVSVRDLKSVKSLLFYGASVDYNEGRALGIAVSSEDLNYIVPILQHQPKTETVNAVFPRVTELSHPVQLDITCRLIDAGATGAPVDEVLTAAVSLPMCQRDHPFINTLVEAGADVGKMDGFLLREVVRDGDLKTLKLLLQGAFPTAIAFSCIPFAMNLGDRQRYEIVEALVDRGARGGPVVAQALVDSIDETRPSAIRVTELLLTSGAANTAFNNGEAFKMAITCQGLEYLQLLVLFNQLAETEFCSCLVLAIRLPRDDMRLEKVKLLLSTGANMSSENWYTALKSEMLCLHDGGSEPSAVLQLLLDAGADVNYHNGQVICDAVNLGLFETFTMYICCSLTSQSHEEAFTTALAYGIKSMDLRFMQELLKLDTPATLLDKALVVAARWGGKARDLCEALLEHHASPNYESGTPLCEAIKSRHYHPSLLELLLRFELTSEAVGAALNCVFDALQGQERLAAVNLLLTSTKPQEALDGLLLKAVQEDPWDQYLLKSLLRSNASALYNDGECILHSVMKNDIDLLHILQPYFANVPSFVSNVFKTAWQQGARAESQEAALSLLLNTGATGKHLNVALAETIETFDPWANSFPLILNLLNAGADVNYDNGVCLVKAAAKGNLRVLEQLLKHGPERDYMTLAFPHIFTSGVDSQTLTDLVHAFCSHSSRPSFTESPRPILHLLLGNYTNEIDLLKYLIKAHCPSDPPVETSRGTYVSLLCWALGEDKNRISDDIIDVLLDAGADANYKTPSGQTPLEIAISTSRRKAVASLIRHGADPTVLSGITSPKSLLYLAVTTESRAIIRLIMLASPMVHDGALHHAAREVNVPILEILVTEGSQRDYAYSGCEGRTALAELCLKGDGTKPRHELVRAMTLLTNRHRPNFKKKSNRKSALHLALDNQHNATFMTQALLDSGMGEYVNDEFNLYEEDGLVYSPLAYVSKGRNKASNTFHRDSLVKILTQFGCKDRFWAIEGKPQPVDAVDPPYNISRPITEQKDHERMLDRIRGQSDAARASIAAQHELLLKNELELANQRAKLEKEAEARYMKMAETRHAAELAHIGRLGYSSSNDSLLTQLAKFERERRQAEMEHLTKQQKLIAAACKERADIEKENREANAREMRRLRELWYEIDCFD
ncbi:hypothetical protein BJY01DRAFT_245103 [Aspergillus pseudoustus]|uniref:Ankyrin repeat-containing domain protein n=1 Tax=Aspergillus pseudoustus TaxID=1810923 RepID=A0ABR4KFW0_9EURO